MRVWSDKTPSSSPSGYANAALILAGPGQRPLNAVLVRTSVSFVEADQASVVLKRPLQLLATGSGGGGQRLWQEQLQGLGLQYSTVYTTYDRLHAK